MLKLPRRTKRVKLSQLKLDREPSPVWFVETDRFREVEGEVVEGEVVEDEVEQREDSEEPPPTTVAWLADSHLEDLVLTCFDRRRPFTGARTPVSPSLQFVHLRLKSG